MTNSRATDRINDSAAGEVSTFFDAGARAAMEQAVSQAIADHHRDGQPVVIWEEGRIVKLFPDGTTRPITE